jgi:hypothetical protein
MPSDMYTVVVGVGAATIAQPLLWRADSVPKPSVLHSGQECGHDEAACAVSAKVRGARAHAGYYGRGIPYRPPHVGS